MKVRDTLLLVGGTENDRITLREICQDEYNLLEAGSIEQGLFLLEQNTSCIATVIVATDPPDTPSDSFLYNARARDILGDIPVLVVITPTGTGKLEKYAFSLGASDVISRTSLADIFQQRIHVLTDLFRSRQSLLSVLEKTSRNDPPHE